MTLIFAFVLVALLAFANGSNDVSKSVATLVGSGVTDYRRALRWGSAWTVIGAFLGGLLATSLAERFARSLGSSAANTAAIPLAVAAGSLVWVAFSSRTGFPVSTTHAITGSILGVGWMAQGLNPLARTDVLQGFFVPLLASPFLALGLTFLLTPWVTRLSQWLDSRCLCAVPSVGSVTLGGGDAASASPATGLVVGRTAACEGRSMWSWNLSVDRAHWVSSALVSLSRGMNDAPKIWALLFPLLLVGGHHPRGSLPAVVATVALAMGLGSWLAGRRVSEFLAEKVTPMNHQGGFAANLATAVLVVGASRLGLPVSTTHVSAGAIVGVGLGQGGHGIRWRVFTEMATAWVVTLPAAGLVAMACYWFLGSAR